MKLVTEILVNRLPFEKKFAFAAVLKKGDKYFVGGAIPMNEQEEDMPIEPTFKLNNVEAQFLFDELFRAGLRPSDGSGSIGQLEATERHLEDMRKIALQFIKPKLLTESQYDKEEEKGKENH